MKIRKPFAKILAGFLAFLLLALQAVVGQSESKGNRFIKLVNEM